MDNMSSHSSYSNNSSRRHSSNSSGKNENRDWVQFNDPFPTAIAKTAYKDIVNVPLDYNIYLDNSGQHWYLLIHAKKSSLPYITLEITTDSHLKHLVSQTLMISTMRVITVVEEAVHTATTVLRNWMPLREAGAIIQALMHREGAQELMLAFGGTNKTHLGCRKTTIIELCETAEEITGQNGRLQTLVEQLPTLLQQCAHCTGLSNT